MGEATQTHADPRIAPTGRELQWQVSDTFGGVLLKRQHTSRLMMSLHVYFQGDDDSFESKRHKGDGSASGKGTSSHFLRSIQQ